MALIKDKYRKSPKNRSRYLVDRKVIKEPSVVSPYKTTEQKLSTLATKRRNEINTENKTKNVSTIFGKELSTVTKIENVFTLKAGSTLKDVIISHYHVSGTSSTLSLYWSVLPKENLTFTIGEGVVTRVTGGKAFRLFTETFTSQSALSLANSGLFNTFRNINKDIYFYAICNVLGPTLTIVKSNENNSKEV